MLQTSLVFAITLLSIFCSNSNEQKEKRILISFTIDDSVQNITDSFRIDFISGVDTLSGMADKNFLNLPGIEKDTTYEVVFNYATYSLSFKEVTKQMIVPEQNIEWKFGIDNRPFNNLLGLLPYEEFKTDTTTKQLIYFQFSPMESGTGIQFVQKRQ